MAEKSDKKQKIDQWPLKKLIPDPQNPRKNDHAIADMAAAIRVFGFRVPILVKSSGHIVDGHLRYKAAISLGLYEVPVILCDDMTDEEIEAFRISVNRMAELASWDKELLSLKITGLKDIDFNVSLIGFTDESISKLIPPAHRLDYNERELVPYRRTHILISFPPERLLELAPLIAQITAITGVEYEQSSN